MGPCLSSFPLFFLFLFVSLSLNPPSSVPLTHSPTQPTNPRTTPIHHTIIHDRRSVATRKLADHVAFLTNHVVLVPDLYRGQAPLASRRASLGASLRELRQQVRVRWLMGG